MKGLSKLCLVFLLVGFMLARVGDVEGQATQSTILGTVTDPSGAVVTGASVTVKNEGTSFERTMVTNENGDYRVAGLEVGKYQVSVSAPGFKTFVRSRIDLDASQIKRVDSTLEVGEASNTVTVVGDVGHLETETSSLSNVKTTQDFVQLPQSVVGSWMA
jgi:Carboxypeptidase regulatory-like domain